MGVGAAGQRLTRLAADDGLLASLPEGAGADLASLAATVVTFAERFPRWVAYNTDAAPPAAPGVASEQPAFEAIAKALEAAEDVDEDVKDEYRDEFEATREAPQDEAAARGLLASTRELLRTLAEDALIGGRLYAEGAARGMEYQVREFAAVIPGEVRKKSFWASVTIGYDLFFHKSAMLLALSEQFPAVLGWLPAVLRALGAI